MGTRTLVLVSWLTALGAASPAPAGAPAVRGVGSAAPEPNPPPPIAATLKDVAFMAGHWVGGDGGDLSEEVWAEPGGDSMMGMWRYVKDGRTRIFELLSLTPAGPGIVLRIRHFNPQLVAREEKESPVALPLVSKAKDLAVFEGVEHGSSVRLTYRRESDDSLASVLEKGGVREEFRFRLRR